MIVLAAVDDRNGMMFNHRRQSQDRVLRERILKLTSGGRLWMDEYSAKQFGENSGDHLNVSEDFMSKALPGDFCFVEDKSVTPYVQLVEKIIIFKWNRVYPGDTFFEIRLTEDRWRLVETEDFPGYSHEKITMEVYERV